VRLAVLVDPEGAVQYSDSVFVFQVENCDDGSELRRRAFARALKLGIEQEEEYLNEAGDRVRWRLKEVVTLDLLGDELLDGMEVTSDLVDLEPDATISFDAVFNPEASKPTQTGVGVF
jgi:hypothetical protein